MESAPNAGDYQVLKVDDAGVTVYGDRGAVSYQIHMYVRQVRHGRLGLIVLTESDVDARVAFVNVRIMGNEIADARVGSEAKLAHVPAELHCEASSDELGDLVSRARKVDCLAALDFDGKWTVTQSHVKLADHVAVYRAVSNQHTIDLGWIGGDLAGWQDHEAARPPPSAIAYPVILRRVDLDSQVSPACRPDYHRLRPVEARQQRGITSAQSFWGDVQ